MRVGTGLWAFDKGGSMIELNLLDSLAERLRAVFKDYELPAKSGLLQTVKVFTQYLPQPSGITLKAKSDTEAIVPQGYTSSDIESNFPCVVVKVDESTDNEEGTLTQTRVKMRLLVGTYDDSPDCQGYRDVMNIIEVIRQDLETMPGRVLDGRYRLEMPLTHALFEEQSWPIYFGQINTEWETGRPLMPRNFDMKHGG
ncbi:MAG: hypothetical protein IJP89_06965 [Synergistaceae bacterium]|nr:hypothetical protein [Synergistaceae bacterium]